MPDAQALVERLEQAFETTREQRMSDMPFLNHKLCVQAVGFRRYENHWLGVMITPWFMNLMRLPDDTLASSTEPEPGEHILSFPSGSYTFVTGHESVIGDYQSCSLFSPMFEFADQDAAVQTAQAIMAALLTETRAEPGDINQEDIEALWKARVAKNEQPALDSTDVKVMRADTEKTISRRELLRGAFLCREDAR